MSPQAKAEQAKTIFLKAAEYIREYGWQEKGMGVYGAPRCSMGALASAFPHARWDPELAQLMYAQLQKELNGITLTDFNHMHQNGEEVARLFERTAKSFDSLSARNKLPALAVS